MRAYYQHASTIHRFAEGLIARVTENSAGGRFFRRTPTRKIRPGVIVQGNLLSIAEPDFFKHDPINLITIYADCQAQNVSLSGSTYQLVRDNLGLIDDEHAQRSARRASADDDSLGAPARRRHARGDASLGRARRDHSRVRQPLRARAARPLPHLYRRPAFAGRGARARTPARRRVQGCHAAADRGRARAPAAAAGISRAAAPRHRQGPRPRPS